jgi:hypothetical protein
LVEVMRPLQVGVVKPEVAPRARASGGGPA